MNATTIIIEAAGVLAAGSTAAYLGRHLFMNSGPRSSGFVSAAEFKPVRYGPMLRLFSTDDLRFLLRSGADKQALARFQADRRRLILSYLRNLSADFSQIDLAMRRLMVNAPMDRPELPKLLLEQRVRFTYQMTRIRLQLYVPGLQLNGAQVQAAMNSLTSVFDQMRSLQQQTAMAPMGA
jgi:hypothetical protein